MERAAVPCLRAFSRSLSSLTCAPPLSLNATRCAHQYHTLCTPRAHSVPHAARQGRAVGTRSTLK
eukprot:3667986-Rhodomonas_salina.1